MATVLLDQDQQIQQFNRLMTEVLRGSMSRNSFQRWEIEILLDIQRCPPRAIRKRETLRRYQRAVQRQLEHGGPAPMLLSEYLGALRAKRKMRAASCDTPLLT